MTMQTESVERKPMSPACGLAPCISADCDSQWYVATTAPHHEKWVARQLDGSHIQHFLPLYRSLRRWKDRRKELELPLFPGYLFVRIPLAERLSVLRTPGVVQIVGFQGKPHAVPESEIETLRQSMLHGTSLQPHPYLRIGRRVRVQNGPLAGMEGILVRRKDALRVVLSVDVITRSFAVEVDTADIHPA
jgi:transcription antitermination factor NusG